MRQLGLVGKVHSIESLGALDGPGIRTVIFLSGCPLRCKYCHNPDTWAADGEERTAEELAEFCGRYKNYYGESGGVTLSGGEPLMQAEFCERLITLLHNRGIRVAIDTGGGVFAPEVLSAADLTILDIKHTDEAAYIELTGQSNANMLKTLEYLKANNKAFWIRQVIVSGITDSSLQVLKLKEMAIGAEKIELLSYHDMGRDKWEKLKIPYPLEGVLPPSLEKMRELSGIING